MCVLVFIVLNLGPEELRVFMSSVVCTNINGREVNFKNENYDYS